MLFRSRDPRYGVEKAELARNFINKIWNATKFYLNMADNDVKVADYSLADKWILTKLQNIIKSTTKRYEKFDFGIAANELQGFFWGDFCDWYIEACKVTPNKKVFGYVLTEFLKLINPVMPFVTEQIYCVELGLAKSLLRENFPIENKKMNFAKEKKEFDKLIELVQSIRNAKKEVAGFQGVVIDKALTKQKAVIEKLTGVNIDLGEKFVLSIDSTEAKKKAEAKVELLKAEIARSEKMLGNAGFVAKAPKALIDAEKQKLADNQAELASLLKG